MSIEWTPGCTLESVERTVIEQAYKFYRSNKTQTADSLKIAIRTLDAKLEKYDSDRRKEEFRTQQLKEERDAHITRQRTAGLPSTFARVSVESATASVTQPTMSLPERKEVQEMLPRQTPKSSSRKTG